LEAFPLGLVFVVIDAALIRSLAGQSQGPAKRGMRFACHSTADRGDTTGPRVVS